MILRQRECIYYMFQFGYISYDLTATKELTKLFDCCPDLKIDCWSCISEEICDTVEWNKLQNIAFTNYQIKPVRYNS